MVFQTEKALKEVGDKVSADDKAKVQAEIDSLKAILERTNIDNLSDADVDALKDGKQKLMDAAQTVFTKMYEAAGANAQGAQGGTSGDAGQAYQADDVVDADYKEV